MSLAMAEVSSLGRRKEALLPIVFDLAGGTLPKTISQSRDFGDDDEKTTL